MSAPGRSSQRPRSLRVIMRFACAVRSAVGVQLSTATLLLCAVALSESVGIMLLLPLLSLAGIGRSAPPDRVQILAQTLLRAAQLQPTLGVVLVLYVFVVGVQALLQRAATISEYRVEGGFAYELKVRLYRQVSYASWRTLVATRKADVAHAIANEADRAGAAAAQLLYLISQTLLVAVYAALALAVSPALTAGALSIGAVILLATRGSAAQASRAGVEVTRAAAALSKTAAEHMGALKVARAEGLEKFQLGLFRRSARRVADANSAAGAVFARVRVESTLVSVMALALLTYASITVLHVGAASLLLLLFLFSRLAPRISSARETWQMLCAGIPAYHFVNDLTVSLSNDSPGRAFLDTDATDFSGAPLNLSSVHLDTVSFAYGNSSVLSGVSLRIPATGIIAIAGESGAGKTTLADIVAGLLAPDTGAVLVNGTRLEGEHLERWRDSIAYVSQESVLFDDTVRANLLWARPDADEDGLKHALSLANALNLVQSLPQGLDTRLGDRGTLLSGGERQRLALARALLREPKLLILDEPTSSLDMRSERRILRTIRTLGLNTAVLLVTHRPSALRYADAIYMLENGRLMERAKPAPGSARAVRT